MPEQLRRVKVRTHGTKRKCPFCQSSNWHWLKTIPTTIEELNEYLLMLFKCEKCGQIFEAEEKGRAELVESTDRCFNCQSKNVFKVSKPNADIELYFCKQCHCYMGIKN
jgi:transposase-like protein